MFYSTYGSKHCKESIDKLTNGMTLPEFLEYKDFIDIQNSLDLAMSKDQEAASRAAK